MADERPKRCRRLFLTWPPPEEIAWLDEAELVDDEGVVAVPGAAELVAMLRRIPWAVVTSAGPELARRRLTAAGLPVPPVLVSSNDVVQGKPAPDGYLLAAERLSVAASNAVVFEDAPAGWPPGELQGAPLSVWPRHTRPHSSRAPTLSWLT